VGRVIKNLEQLTVPPNEVIITSTNLDGKLQSESFLITSLCSEQEKSQLITPAVEASTQDWCLILQEGDSLKPNNLEKLNKAIRNNSDIIGGTLGHHFLQKSQQSLLTEVISEFRALFMQPCPVEQSQFFHRLTAMQKNVTTGREINYLLKTHGEILSL